MAIITLNWSYCICSRCVWFNGRRIIGTGTRTSWVWWIKIWRWSYFWWNEFRWLWSYLNKKKFNFTGNQCKVIWSHELMVSSAYHIRGKFTFWRKSCSRYSICWRVKHRIHFNNWFWKINRKWDWLRNLNCIRIM